MSFKSIEEFTISMLVGFGSFEVVRRAERKVRNPRTGEPLKIEAKKVVKFRAEKRLRKPVSL